MKMHPRALYLVLLIAAAASGCRFISAEEGEDPYFEATVADVEMRGESRARLEGSDLQIWGEFLHPDSTTRFVEFTLADFDGEGTYHLGRTTGTYGAITESNEIVRYGYSSGRRDDAVRISSYDEDEGVVRGDFFFHAEAFVTFDTVGRHQGFSASGRFRAELD